MNENFKEELERIAEEHMLDMVDFFQKNKLQKNFNILLKFI
jgi:hypothetical protein